VGHDGGVEELILRTVVIQFDGRVVEVFGDHSNEVVRAHVALMKEPQILGPNRKGRRLVSVGATSIGVDEDEWARLTPLLAGSGRPGTRPRPDGRRIRRAGPGQPAAGSADTHCLTMTNAKPAHYLRRRPAVLGRLQPACA
jgi:hypothetical protein